MEYILENFKEEYDSIIQRRIYHNKVVRSANNPILFVFLGDGVKEAYKYIESSIRHKWDNGEGIAFINITADNVEHKDDSFNFQFDFKDKKSLRKNIREKFYSDRKELENLNKKIKILRDKILSSGSLFNSFENISISVVTASDDPLNILVPEVTLLIRKKMLEVFKTGTLDLYVLVKEKNMEDEFFSRALSVSFFREIEYMQSEGFRFDEKTDVYGEDRELSVSFSGAVFYMTYVLEEKNEKGIIPENSMVNNYEIIAYLNLIKNRSVSIDNFANTENQHYDNARFKANILREDSLNRYVTAGLSKVRRPGGAICITVLKDFYERIVGKLNELSMKKVEFITEILKIDELGLNSKVDDILPKHISIMDMKGIMMSPVSKVEGFTLKQIEEKLYGDRCENFFRENFIIPSKNNLEAINIEAQIKALVKENITDNTKLGLYCALNWMGEEGPTIKYLRDKIKFIDRIIDNIKNEINSLYESRFIEGFSLENFFVKSKGIKEAKTKIFKDIYERKLEILRLNISKNIIKQYENILLKIHGEVSEEAKNLMCIGETIKSYEDSIIKNEDDYASQNVKVYYKNVVKNILDNLEKDHGEAFYLEDNYMGNLSVLLREGKEKVLKKMILFCNKYIFTEDEFKLSFEEEFNKRANVNLSDYNLKVLSREELYRKLYNILEDNSALKSHIMNYDVKGYQEKYFFGDYSSDFIKYAFDFDRKTRNYKIGYIHEIKSSGIEKLNLMGGFGAKDIIYVKSSIEFYNYCLENEYLLHGIDAGLLPHIV
ncbi:hypothetical protein [Clostridium kluyveri]|uniref:Uncharacterized protein n=1 Tax=Clostridium kluyveri TaxID=1534 RepID=A0A1L5F7V0_CLOKL|nr:hypothetical protein [Clostridium kluyveri]APM39106.1 hypothetical protein BS101_10300 [Clostridium kluyveri]